MRSTKALVLVVVGGGLAGGWTTALHAQESPAQAPRTVTAGRTITATATVEKVDLAKREVAVKSDTGSEFTISVPESVSRLDNVKPGDTVTVSFRESLALSLLKPGEPASGMRKKTVGGPTPGELPGGVGAQTVTTSGTITKIDRSRDEVTIETPSGKANTIQVDDPSLRAELSHLKVGDPIQVTYTQAMAITVSAPGRT